MTQHAAAAEYIRAPRKITPTRVELASRCQRRHVLNDLLHLSEPDELQPYRVFGTVGHRFSHVFWRRLAEDPDARVAAWEEAREELGSAWEEEEAEKHCAETYQSRELMDTLLDEYVKTARLAGDLPGEWRLLEAEQRRRVELPGGYVVTYQTDRLLENEHGDLCIVDMKTAGKLGSLWLEGMKRSIQQRLYKRLEQERLGREINYVLVEGVQKKVTPGQIEYVWADLNWTPAYVEEAWGLLLAALTADARFAAGLDLDAQGEDLWREALEVALTDPERVPFNYMDCNAYYRQCEYFELCHAAPEDRLGLALGDFTCDVYEY